MGTGCTSEAEALAAVRAFCAAWSRLDMLQIEALLAENVVYRNGPLPVIRSKAAVMDYIRGAGPFEEMKWELLNISVSENIVLTERVDHLVRNGKSATLPIMGAFEIADGQIVEWRDYFDLASYRAQFAQEKGL
ncbi:limonene-1,2-epoxide hydrolase family protein [Pacificimonas sp. ICDLI1SI03]